MPYRLLSVGEKIFRGDEIWSITNKWNAVYIDNSNPHIVETGYAPIRRYYNLEQGYIPKYIQVQEVQVGDDMWKFGVGWIKVNNAADVKGNTIYRRLQVLDTLNGPDKEEDVVKDNSSYIVSYADTSVLIKDLNNARERASELAEHNPGYTYIVAKVTHTFVSKNVVTET